MPPQHYGATPLAQAAGTSGRVCGAQSLEGPGSAGSRGAGVRWLSAARVSNFLEAGRLSAALSGFNGQVAPSGKPVGPSPVGVARGPTPEAGAAGKAGSHAKVPPGWHGAGSRGGRTTSVSPAPRAAGEASNRHRQHPTELKVARTFRGHRDLHHLRVEAVQGWSLWSKCGWPNHQASSPVSQLLPRPSPLECQSPEDDIFWSVHLAQLSQALLVNMAAGKGVLRSPSSENSWWFSEPDQSEGCKPVQLDKANSPGSKGTVGGGGQDETSVELALLTPPGKLRLGKPLTQKVCWEQRQRAFMEVPWLKKRLQGRKAKNREDSDLTGQHSPQQLTQDIPRKLAGCTVFSAWPGRAQQEQKSAFRKPDRYLSGRSGSASLFQASRSTDALGELLGLIKMVDFPCWSQLSSSKLLVGDFWNLQTLPQNTALWSAFLGAPTLWLKHAMAQIPIPLSSSSTASWALLPPTFPSLGLSTQNWCAKCNLSFHLTSDLVFHMRSHHKKEHAGPDLHSKKLREEALTCPICHEYFRERHHLSRHMTSHS